MTAFASDPWFFVPLTRVAATTRLFCFPYAGGNGLSYRSWPAALPAHVEVWAVQLPGRAPRQRVAPIDRLVPLAEEVVTAIGEHLDLPFVFFGHSMGALLSFEVARRLDRDGHPPEHMFVSGHGAPELPRQAPPIHALPDARFIDELRMYNGTPEEILRNDEVMELLLPVLRADFALVETYEYVDGPPLTCSLSAYGGAMDRSTSREALDAWERHTQGAFDVTVYPGDHFYQEQSRLPLLRRIARVLSQLPSAAGAGSST